MPLSLANVWTGQGRFKDGAGFHKHEWRVQGFILKNHMCQGLNSHYFHIVGDGHQPDSRGLYTHYKDSY